MHDLCRFNLISSFLCQKSEDCSPGRAHSLHGWFRRPWPPTVFFSLLSHTNIRPTLQLRPPAPLPRPKVCQPYNDTGPTTVSSASWHQCLPAWPALRAAPPCTPMEPSPRMARKDQGGDSECLLLKASATGETLPRRWVWLCNQRDIPFSKANSSTHPGGRGKRSRGHTSGTWSGCCQDGSCPSHPPPPAPSAHPEVLNVSALARPNHAPGRPRPQTLRGQGRAGSPPPAGPCKPDGDTPGRAVRLTHVPHAGPCGPTVSSATLSESLPFSEPQFPLGNTRSPALKSDTGATAAPVQENSGSDTHSENQCHSLHVGL